MPRFHLGQAADHKGSEAKRNKRFKSFLQPALGTLVIRLPCEGIIKSLIERWETEDQADNFRKGAAAY